VPDSTTTSVAQLPPGQQPTTSSTTTTVAAGGQLPATGGAPGQTLPVALGVLVLGGLAVLGSRRTS
jgi:LPXTG-motif cell wall-anchored protein